MSKYDIHQNTLLAQAVPNQASTSGERKASQAAAKARARRERYQGDLTERHERPEGTADLIDSAQAQVARKLA